MHNDGKRSLWNELFSIEMGNTEFDLTTCPMLQGMIYQRASLTLTQ